MTIAIHVPPEWVRIYNEREYARIDPSIRYCRQMVRPFRWSDAPYDPEREPEVLPFLKGSADFALTWIGTLRRTRMLRRRPGSGFQFTVGDGVVPMAEDSARKCYGQ